MSGACSDRLLAPAELYPGDSSEMCRRRFGDEVGRAGGIARCGGFSSRFVVGIYVVRGARRLWYAGSSMGELRAVKYFCPSRRAWKMSMGVVRDVIGPDYGVTELPSPGQLLGVGIRDEEARPAARRTASPPPTAPRP